MSITHFFTFEVPLNSLANVEVLDLIYSQCANRSYCLEQVILFGRGKANCLYLFTLHVCAQKN